MRVFTDLRESRHGSMLSVSTFEVSRGIRGRWGFKVCSRGRTTWDAEVGRGQVQSRKCGVGTDYDAESLLRLTTDAVDSGQRQTGMDGAARW